MSHSVLMKRTGQVYTLEDEDAEELKLKRFAATRPFLIDLEGDQYQSSDIQSITKNPETKHTIPDFEQAALPEGNKCHGANSIQNQVNQIIKDEHPADWSKKIRDRSFREVTRQRLRAAAPTGWCDYKQGECVC